jgi:predicted dienelactone hydrolase
MSPSPLRHSLFFSAALTLGLAGPSAAADQMNLRFGPFEQTVNVSDVEIFAKTGTIPEALQIYAPVLTPEVRKGLSSKVAIDPKLGSRVIDDLLKSPSGKQLLETMKLALPGLTPEQLQVGLSLAAKQANGLDAISVIKAIPQKTVTVDISQAMAIASKLNWGYWKTQAMGTLLQSSLAAEETTPPFSAPFDATAVGKETVQQQTLSLTDTKRQRTIPVDLYWSQNSKSPLVVIAPGYEANKEFLAYLAKHLASHGFTVAALEHPPLARNGKINLEQLLPATEMVERPQDVSFLLDELAEINRSGDLTGKLNTQQVMVIGHSLGGYTALALAGGELNLDELRQFCSSGSVLDRVPADWLQCAATKLPEKTLNLRDRRVVQVMALNPAIGHIFGKSGLAKVDTPALILSSTEDALTPALSQQFQPFTQLPAPKYLLTAIGSTHLSVSDPTYFSGGTVQSTLVKERRGPEVASLRKALQGISLAFVEQLTPAAKTYAPFLTPGYAQSLSTPSLPLRLNQELPTSLTRLLKLTAMI